MSLLLKKQTILPGFYLYNILLLMGCLLANSSAHKCYLLQKKSSCTSQQPKLINTTIFKSENFRANPSKIIPTMCLQYELIVLLGTNLTLHIQILTTNKTVERILLSFYFHKCFTCFSQVLQLVAAEREERNANVHLKYSMSN